MASNIFDVLSGGQWIDLGSRLTPEEISSMGGCIKKTCPACDGDGIEGMVGVITPEGILMMPIPCDLCGGEGEAAYICHN